MVTAEEKAAAIVEAWWDTIQEGGPKEDLAALERAIAAALREARAEALEEAADSFWSDATAIKPEWPADSVVQTALRNVSYALRARAAAERET